MKSILKTIFLLLILLIPLNALAMGQSVLSFADSLAAEEEHYRAITEYKRFLHLFPEAQEAPRARLSIARSLIAGERWGQADLALEVLIKKHPKSPEAGTARQTYADIAFDRDDYETARERYLSLLEESSDQADRAHAHYRIGWTFLEEDRIEEARTSFAHLESGRASELSISLDDYQKLPKKSPALAGTLSAVLPGAGQLYTGRIRQAVLAFGLNAAFIYGAIEAFENDNHAVGGILLFFETGWYTGNIYNAVNNAHKYNQRQQAKHKGEMRQRFGLQLGWENHGPTLTALLRF